MDATEIFTSCNFPSVGWVINRHFVITHTLKKWCLFIAMAYIKIAVAEFSNIFPPPAIFTYFFHEQILLSPSEKIK